MQRTCHIKPSLSLEGVKAPLFEPIPPPDHSAGGVRILETDKMRQTEENIDKRNFL